MAEGDQGSWLADSYVTGTWNGLENFECVHCPYATTDRDAIRAHVVRTHRPAIAPQRPPPPPSVDRFGNPNGDVEQVERIEAQIDAEGEGSDRDLEVHALVDDNTRDDLELIAGEAGVDAPGSYPSKHALAVAIVEARVAAHSGQEGDG